MQDKGTTVKSECNRLLFRKLLSHRDFHKERSQIGWSFLPSVRSLASEPGFIAALRRRQPHFSVEMEKPLTKENNNPNIYIMQSQMKSSDLASKDLQSLPLILVQTLKRKDLSSNGTHHGAAFPPFTLQTYSRFHQVAESGSGHWGFHLPQPAGYQLT